VLSADLQATASCARVDAGDRILAVSCAGAQPPWIVRSTMKVVRVQTTASVGLGTLKGAQFAARTLHFDRGDALLLASSAWTPVLEQTLENNVPPVARLAEWLRGHPSKPPGGCALTLTMR
jgi:hypothetical protein